VSKRYFALISAPASVGQSFCLVDGGCVADSRSWPPLVPPLATGVEITAPATGARAVLDVRTAYAPYCREHNADNPYCPAQTLK
jgi:hypothetical protein